MIRDANSLTRRRGEEGPTLTARRHKVHVDVASFSVGHGQVKDDVLENIDLIKLTLTSAGLHLNFQSLIVVGSFQLSK